MFLFFFLNLLVVAVISAAKPIEMHQAVGGVTICTGPQRTGKCSHEVYKLDIYHNMTAEFLRNTDTFAPDRAKFYCQPYLTSCGSPCKSPTGCTPGPISHETLDRFDLAAMGGGWDHLIASFECHSGMAPI
ncbi:hypothetical protein F5883DRAFT_691488 [Diaporthe sp. PMI_573]|nr:hypothetical protein F5883DRAFT_691488 [Diaporthaceae sp. PMI_573]